MDIHVRRQGQHWVIVRTEEFFDMTIGVYPRFVSRIREIDKVWSDGGWSEQREAALLFPTAEEANLYMENHRDRLTQ